MLYISLSANNKNIDKILKKAESLKLEIRNDVSWDDGFKYSDKSTRNVTVFEYSDNLWNYLLELEPPVDMSKKTKLLASHLTIPSPEEVVKLGY